VESLVCGSKTLQSHMDREVPFVIAGRIVNRISCVCVWNECEWTRQEKQIISLTAEYKVVIFTSFQFSLRIQLFLLSSYIA
jgi:hypothetical protein